MISYIKGIITYKQEEYIFVETNNIGYEVFVPKSIVAELPGIDQEVKIFTYLYVREDVMRLYGFLSMEDLQVFKELITVSGIGPKGALSILATLTPDSLRVAVITNNVELISSVKGIGKKTAGKLVIELKDKLEKLSLDEVMSGEEVQVTSAAESKNIEEALEALVALGYKAYEVNKALRHVDASLDVEDIIKQAFSNLTKE